MKELRGGQSHDGVMTGALSQTMMTARRPCVVRREFGDIVDRRDFGSHSQAGERPKTRGYLSEALSNYASSASG